MPALMAITQQEEKQNIVQRYSSQLLRFIRSRVNSAADAEDILQDVWFQFSRVVDTQPIDQISGWLYRVARNRITDRYRKRKDESLEAQTFRNENDELVIPEFMSNDDFDPEMEMLRNLFWETLFDALELLPEDQKNVFVWNELEDQTFQEIADRTGVNIKTLISRKRYAVQFLRTQLKDLYEDFEINESN